METFRALFLNEGQMANTPVEGYTNSRKFSRKANSWLDHIEESRGVSLVREYRIGPYWVDGFDKDSNTGFEYFGCYFHGCPCQKGDRLAKVITRKVKDGEKKYSLDDLYNETLARLEFLKEKHNIISVWECQFEKSADENTKRYYHDRQKYHKKMEEIGHINIRDALF